MNKLILGVSAGAIVSFGLTYILVAQPPTPKSQVVPQLETAEQVYGFGLGYRDGSGRGARNNVDGQNCLGDECLAVQDLEYPAATLDETVVSALERALQDEFHARAIYASVIDQFGAVRPFSMIINAEEQHINALKALFDKYGVIVPAEDPIDVPTYETFAETCQAGVTAEIANAALYRDELLPAVQDHEDIVFVFTNLMDASQQKHLPAFERCAR
ncbi:MAG: DUF2202 domain-containing protein [Patescibacteria group bacterium]